MVDILVEILGNTLNSELKQTKKSLTYKIRTHWANVEVEAFRERVLLKLPKLPISKCFPRNDKEIWVFVEFWTREGDEKSEFFGLTKYLLDPLLKDSSLNPSLQWLNVINPIENTKLGMLLFKIEANYSEGISFLGPDIPKTLFSPRTSSYFNKSPSSLSSDERKLLSAGVQTDSFTEESHESLSSPIKPPIINHPSEPITREKEKNTDIEELAELEKQLKRLEISPQSRDAQETKYPNIRKYIEKSLKPTTERRLKPVVFDEKSFIPDKVITTKAVEKGQGDIGFLNEIMKFNQNPTRFDRKKEEAKVKSNEADIPSISALSKGYKNVSSKSFNRNAAALYNNWDI